MEVSIILPKISCSLLRKDEKWKTTRATHRKIVIIKFFLRNFIIFVQSYNRIILAILSYIWLFYDCDFPLSFVYCLPWLGYQWCAEMSLKKTVRFKYDDNSFRAQWVINWLKNLQRPFFTLGYKRWHYLNDHDVTETWGRWCGHTFCAL